MMYQCSKCSEAKSEENFYSDKSRKTGKTSMCKLCADANSKRYRAQNPSKVKARRNDWHDRNKIKVKDQILQRRYGITLKEKQTLYENQGSSCGICKKLVPCTDLHVDHDHKVGLHDSAAVRGLVCTKCNFGLGYFDDNPVLLSNAISYIQLYQNVLTGSKEFNK